MNLTIFWYRLPSNLTRSCLVIIPFSILDYFRVDVWAILSFAQVRTAPLKYLACRKHYYLVMLGALNFYELPLHRIRGNRLCFFWGSSSSFVSCVSRIGVGSGLEGCGAFRVGIPCFFMKASRKSARLFHASESVALFLRSKTYS
jgi:hypothetical protein